MKKSKTRGFELLLGRTITGISCECANYAIITTGGGELFALSAEVVNNIPVMSVEKMKRQVEDTREM